MKSRLTKGAPLLLVGMSFYGDPFAKGAGWTHQNEIGRLWQRFMAFVEANPDAIKHRTDADTSIEGHFESAETKEKGLSEVFVGFPVAKLEDIPLECVVKVLPPVDYLIFTLEGSEIRSDWPSRIHLEEVPRAGYAAAYPYCLEYYDARFKGLDQIDQSELDIHVPVKRV